MTPQSAVLVIAVPAAVLGAASFGIGSALQHRAAQEVSRRRTLDPHLLWELARKPAWMASIALVMTGLLLQALSLAFGPLVLIQPLLVSGVFFGAAAAAWMAKRSLDPVLLLGALACMGGLAAFLLLARPSGNRSEISGMWVLPLGTALGLLFAGCLVLAARFPGRTRVVCLALATGVLYGLTAALIKVVAGDLRAGGMAELFRQPTLYIVCVIGPAGFLLSQNTFQQGKLVSPALAIITTTDPLIGILIGIMWMGEQVVTTPAVLAGQALAGLVLIGGIVVLTYRAHYLRGLADQRIGQGRPGDVAWG